MQLPPARRALVALAALVATGFVASMLLATGGYFVPQVVDLYVVCQYAKAMAEGHAFRYNPGEPFSTGATSLLHTVVLALAHAAGARGEGLVAFAVLLGAGLYLGSVALACRIGARLAGEREGLLAGALVALGGPVVWGFLYGSDIALALFLSLLVLDHLTADPGRPSRGVVVATSLLALARPEGLVVAAVLGVAWARERGAGRRSRLVAWIPTAAGVAVLALNRALTGQWLWTSVADKSLLLTYAPLDVLALVSEYAVDVTRGLLLGFYPSQAPIGFARGWAPLMFPPLGLVLALLALGGAADPARRRLRLWALAVLVALALGSANVFLGVHFNRHVLWAFPSLLVMVAVGLGALARAATRGDAGLERSLFRGAASLLLALGALSTLRFAAYYGEAAGEIGRRELPLAGWIARNLPPGVAIANAATSVEYLTGHRNLNLHGVTSPAFFGGRTAEREASVLEGLARLPASERPPFLITSSAAQEANAALRELASGQPLFRTLSLSDELLLYRLRYDLVDNGGRPFLPETLAAVAGLTERDRLNVCDDRDEAAHAYAFRSRLGDLRLHGATRVADYLLPDGVERVMDAGRVILGGESFRVRTLPGRELLIVLRCARSARAGVFRASGNAAFDMDLPAAELELAAGGRTVARAAFAPREGWDERVLRVPASAVRSESTRLELRGRYAAFRYWFFQ